MRALSEHDGPPTPAATSSGRSTSATSAPCRRCQWSSSTSSRHPVEPGATTSSPCLLNSQSWYLRGVRRETVESGAPASMSRTPRTASCHAGWFGGRTRRDTVGKRQAGAGAVRCDAAPRESPGLRAVNSGPFSHPCVTRWGGCVRLPRRRQLPPRWRRLGRSADKRGCGRRQSEAVTAIPAHASPCLDRLRAIRTIAKLAFAFRNPVAVNTDGDVPHNEQTDGTHRDPHPVERVDTDEREHPGEETRKRKEERPSPDPGLGETLVGKPL